MRSELITCDACGKQKQGTNHWFVLLRSEEPAETSLIINTEVASRYAGKVGTTGSWVKFDLCGEACVLKKVSELIAK